MLVDKVERMENTIVEPIEINTQFFLEYITQHKSNNQEPISTIQTSIIDVVVTAKPKFQLHMKSLHENPKSSNKSMMRFDQADSLHFGGECEVEDGINENIDLEIENEGVACEIELDLGESQEMGVVEMKLVVKISEIISEASLLTTGKMLNDFANFLDLNFKFEPTLTPIEELNKSNDNSKLCNSSSNCCDQIT